MSKKRKHCDKDLHLDFLNIYNCRYCDKQYFVSFLLNSTYGIQANNYITYKSHLISNFQNVIHIVKNELKKHASLSFFLLWKFNLFP